MNLAHTRSIPISLNPKGFLNASYEVEKQIAECLFKKYGKNDWVRCAISNLFHETFYSSYPKSVRKGKFFARYLIKKFYILNPNRNPNIKLSYKKPHPQLISSWGKIIGTLPSSDILAIPRIQRERWAIIKDKCWRKDYKTKVFSEWIKELYPPSTERIIY